MTGIDLNYRVRIAADDRCIEVGRMEQARKHGFGGGCAVNGQSGKFTDTVVQRTQCTDLLRVQLVGRQPFFGVKSDTHGAYELTLVVGEKRKKIRILSYSGELIPAPGVPPLH